MFGHFAKIGRAADYSASTVSGATWRTLTNRIAEQKEKSNQTKARPIKRKIQEAINFSVYFSSLFLPFDIRLLVEIVFGLM
jgi:hypothetical protein